MKWKYLIILCLIVFLLPLAANAENNEKDKPVKKKIPTKIKLRRKAIENYYQDQALELKLRSEAELNKLEIIDLANYSSLAEKARIIELTLGIDEDGFYDENWFDLKNRYRTGTSLHVKRPFRHLNTNLEESTKRFTNAAQKLAQTKDEIIAKYRSQMLELKREKKAALAKITEKTKVTIKETQQPENVVTGILYSQDKPAGIINNRIVYVGDEIDGLRIKAIKKGLIEFEYKKDTWTQTVGEKASKYWK